MDSSRDKINGFGSDSEDDFTLIETAELEEVTGSISDISMSSESGDEAHDDSSSESPTSPMASISCSTEDVVSGTVSEIVSNVVDTDISGAEAPDCDAAATLHVSKEPTIMDLLQLKQNDDESYSTKFQSFCNKLRSNSEAINSFTELAETFMTFVSDVGEEVGFDSKLEIRHEEDKSECESSIESEQQCFSEDEKSIEDNDVPIHTGFVCDGCEQSPLRGIRYHSTAEWDFDLCGNCHASGAWDESHGPFVQVMKPRRSPLMSLAEALSKSAERAQQGEFDGGRGPIHPTVQCDGCDVFPIRGTRFKSSTKEDFDLCEACEGTGDWQEGFGPFLKITHPTESPTLLVVGLDDGQYSSRFGCRRSRCASRTVNEESADEPCIHQSDSKKCRKCRHVKKLSRRFSRQLKKGSEDPWAPVTYTHAKVVETEGVHCVPVVKPGSTFSKTWTLLNDGTSKWPKKTNLRWVGGHEISYEDREYLEPYMFDKDSSPAKLRPEKQINIEVPFTAPGTDGEFESYFQLHDKYGLPFGEKMCLKMIVSSDVGTSGNTHTSEPRSAEPSSENIEDIANAFNDLIQFSAQGLSAIASALVVPPESETDAVTEEGTNEHSNARGDENASVIEGERRSVNEVLQQLRDMGFEDEERNKVLVYKHGTLEAVVEELIQ